MSGICTRRGERSLESWRVSCEERWIFLEHLRLELSGMGGWKRRERRKMGGSRRKGAMIRKMRGGIKSKGRREREEEYEEEAEE